MKAVICTRYGPPEVLRIAEVETPTPAPGEVRIAVRRTTAHVGDARIRGFRVPWAMWLPARLALGLTRPRRSILGMELAGAVDAVGDGVTSLQVGDPVMAFAGMRFGAYAEHVCLPVDGKPKRDGMVVHKPEKVSYEQAAPLTGGAITALLMLRKADIQPGQRVLAYGASGSVGSFAVQLAAHMGAQVTAVCGPDHLDAVRSLGVSAVVDYTSEEFAAHDERYDVVFDAVHKLPRERARQLTAASGIHLDVHTSSDDLVIRPQDLIELGELAASGRVRSLIDRSYPLDDIVEAHRHVDLGHKRGNVIVVVSEDAMADDKTVERGS